jgi:hypothetical protein
MSDPSSDALRDGLANLADSLDGWIEGLPAGDSKRDLLTKAQNDLNDAAVNIAAQQVEQIIKDSADLAKLKNLTSEICTKAEDIAKQEQNVARICGIAAGALSLASAIAAGNVGGIVSAISDVTKIID